MALAAAAAAAAAAFFLERGAPSSVGRRPRGHPFPPTVFPPFAGVDFAHIAGKVAAVLHPTSAVSADILADSDMAGPLLFVVALGVLLLLNGKVHFGAIYGVGGVGECAAAAAATPASAAAATRAPPPPPLSQASSPCTRC